MIVNVCFVLGMSYYKPVVSLFFSYHFSHLSIATAEVFIAIILFLNLAHSLVLLSPNLNSFLIFFLYLCRRLETSLAPGYVKVAP